MKVTYVSCSTVPSIYANSVHVMKMCNQLSRYVDVDLVAKSSDKITKEEVLEYYSCEYDHMNLRLFPTCSNRFLRSFGYIVFASWYILNAKGLIYARYLYPMLCMFICRKKFILEFHNSVSGLNYLISKWLLRKKRCLRAVFITESLRDWFLKQNLIEEHKALVMSDACDIPKQDVGMGYKSKSIDVGYVGHLYEGRGIEVVVELAKRLPNIKFHIVGGSKGDITLWEKKSPSNVVFYGAVPHKDLARYYNLFEIAIAPYQETIYSADKRCETSKFCSPMKLFEYMAYKKAIICSDLPVFHEVSENGENIIFVPCNDIDAWEKAIFKLINDDKLRLGLQINAFDKFINNYTWQSRALKIYDVLNHEN